MIKNSINMKSVDLNPVKELHAPLNPFVKKCCNVYSTNFCCKYSIFTEKTGIANDFRWR